MDLGTIQHVVTSQRVVASQQAVEEGGCSIEGQGNVARGKVRPIEGSHGDWSIRVVDDFHDLTGITSSTQEDGKSQSAVMQPWVNQFQSARRTESVWLGRQDSPLRPHLP